MSSALDAEPVEDEDGPSPVPPADVGLGLGLGLGGGPGDLECSIYQNYSAAEVFVQGLAGVVNQQDVEAIIRAQKKM